MCSSVVVKNVSAIREQLHYVKLISKIHRYVFQYCGNMRCNACCHNTEKLYFLTFYMFNKWVHLVVKRILIG
jgi:hypothetical protein